MINLDISKLSVSFYVNSNEIICFPIIFIYIGYLYFVKTKVKNYIVHNVNISKSRIKSHTHLINRIVASNHAIIQSFICIIYWNYYDNIFTLPNNDSYKIQYLAFDIMNGYLIFDLLIDTIWNIFNNDNISMQMFVHHITGLISMYNIRLYDSVPGFHYIMIVFLAEISTPFLHMSWILYHFNMTNVWYYKPIGYTLILTFFVFRILLSPYLLYKLINERHVWNNSISYMFEVNLLISVLFIILNYLWFTKLIKMAFTKTKTE